MIWINTSINIKIEEVWYIRETLIIITLIIMLFEILAPRTRYILKCEMNRVSN